jgi:hypothetical protein
MLCGGKQSVYILAPVSTCLEAILAIISPLTSLDVMYTSLPLRPIMVNTGVTSLSHQPLHLYLLYILPSPTYNRERTTIDTPNLPQKPSSRTLRRKLDIRSDSIPNSHKDHKNKPYDHQHKMDQERKGYIITQYIAKMFE